MSKMYQGFWMGRSWVSRCSKCGTICFTVAQEQEHDDVSCSKEKLKPLTKEETANPPGTKEQP